MDNLINPELFWVLKLAQKQSKLFKITYGITLEIPNFAFIQKAEIKYQFFQHKNKIVSCSDASPNMLKVFSNNYSKSTHNTVYIQAGAKNVL